ncbi:MAG: O-antigen polysaccharide polymerase Wzy [Bacteroidales bacterium]|nr:O-antigen polysaccharide polymerase Wzy [Bacteroidales bacterium]
MKIRYNTLIRAITFFFLFGLFVLSGFISNYKIRFSSEIFSILIFYYAYLITPSIHVDKVNIVCPKNLMLLIFFTRLVICPVSIMLFGYKTWVLPEFPTPYMIHKASVISDLAFLSFVTGWDFLNEKRAKDFSAVNGKYKFRNNAVLALGLFVVLLFFIFFFYGSFRTYVQTLFLEDYLEIFEGKNRIIIYANIMFKYVIPFLAVILGIHSLEKIKTGIWVKAAVTLFFILLIILLALGPSRNNIVFPVLAFLSAVIPRYLRIKFRDFILGCTVFLVLAFLFQNIRKRSNEDIISELNTGEKFIEFIQVYFVSPHIMTPMFLIDEKFDKVPFTLHSSFIETIPILGMPFREKSGSHYYNAGYGREGARDQVFPTYGEMAFNLGYVGLILSFILTGFIYRKIHIFFQRRTLDDPLFRSIVFYYALVFNSTIFLSYTVFAQFVFYNSVLLFIVMLFRDKPVYERSI